MLRIWLLTCGAGDEQDIKHARSNVNKSNHRKKVIATTKNTVYLSQFGYGVSPQKISSPVNECSTAGTITLVKT